MLLNETARCSSFENLIHRPAEHDRFSSDRYHNRNTEEKVISGALKGLYHKDSIHSLQKQHRSMRQSGEVTL